ncbi:hypothetical protein ACFLSJ_08695, partial [Verrucomicrobiota bacterium]
KMPEGLNPGDKVIALAAAATTAAVIAGAVTAAIGVWIAKHRALLSAAGFVGGGVLGILVGVIVGKVLFPATGGNVMIAKWGPSSLPLTLKGNVIACLLVSLLVCGVIVLITKSDFKAIAGPCIGTSVVIGTILALLASLI